MDQQAPKSVSLPVPQTVLWNQSNPQYKSTESHKILQNLEDSELVNLHNLSQKFLGLAFFNKAEQSFIYLSDQTPKEYLKKTVTHCFQNKAKLHSDFRLLSNETPGLIIDAFSSGFVISCRKGWLPYLPVLEDILKSLLKNPFIYLKNDTLMQRQHQDPIQSKCLTAIAPNLNLKITEPPHTYTWNLDSDDLFKFAYRSLRSWIAASKASKCLVLGCSAPDLISSEQTTQSLVYHDYCKIGITRIKQDLSKQTPKRDWVFIDFDNWIWNSKNQTALFHFFQALHQNQDGAIHLFLHDKQHKKTKNFLKLFCSKNKITLKCIKSAWIESDIDAKISRKSQYYYILESESLSS